jgi:protein-S-isoprenylcysteine O-methyltransferase Ste14
VSPAKNKFALWTSAKIVAALIVLFGLVRIAIPDLINAHDTALLMLAIVLGFAAIGVALWTGVSVWRSYRRLRRAAVHLIKG